MNILDNREHNIEINTIKSTRLGKCRACEKIIPHDVSVVRIKVDGIKSLTTTICFDCVKYMNNLIVNMEI